jgi:hypothetical protein
VGANVRSGVGVGRGERVFGGWRGSLWRGVGIGGGTNFQNFWFPVS